VDGEVGDLIVKIAREKAKYGVVLVIITQSVSDFRMRSKIVREMVTLRFFLRATDRAEHEYIERYESRETVEVIKKLRQARPWSPTPTSPGPSSMPGHHFPVLRNQGGARWKPRPD
jgi:DNA helicase HerA-like ATPase